MWDPFPSSGRCFRLPEDRSSRRVCSSSGRPIRLPEDRIGLPEDGLVFRKTKTQHAQIYQEQSVNMLPRSPQPTGGAKSTKIERRIFRLPEDQPVFQTTQVFRKTGWSSGRRKRTSHYVMMTQVPRSSGRPVVVSSGRRRKTDLT